MFNIAQISQTDVNLLTSARYVAAEIAPVPKPVKLVTNLPNTKFINGSSTPAAMAATKATILRVQLSASAYVKIR